MGFDFSGDRPIYIQIIEFIKEAVLRGLYKPKEKLPSVRDLSLQFEVNPNTVQKALIELEQVGLIYTESTNGKFVTSDTNVIKRIKQEMIDLKVAQFFEAMKNIGLNKEDVLLILNKEDKWWIF